MAVTKIRKRSGKKRSVRKGVWKKNGKGKAYTSQYLYDAKGERVMVLSAFKKDGTIHNVTAESAAMFKRTGWLKVK